MFECRNRKFCCVKLPESKMALREECIRSNPIIQLLQRGQWNCSTAEFGPALQVKKIELNSAQETCTKVRLHIQQTGKK